MGRGAQQATGGRPGPRTRRDARTPSEHPVYLTALVESAAIACQVPMAAVVALDSAGRAACRADVGLDARARRWVTDVPFVGEIPPAGLFLDDSRGHPQLSGHELITGRPFIRALSIIPITETPGDAPLGYLCLMHTRPHRLGGVQRELLRRLSGLAAPTLAAMRMGRVEPAGERVTLMRQLAEGMMSHTDMAVSARDLDGHFLVANPALHAIVGLEDGEIIGRTAASVFPPTEAAEYEANDRDVAERGQARLFAESAVLDDGQLHVYLATKFPLKRPDGSTFAVGGISADVTDLMEARTALADAERLWRDLLRGAPFGLLSLSSNFTLRYLNVAAGRLLGAPSRRALAGWSLLDLLAADVRDALVEWAESATGTPLALPDVEVTTTQGETRYLDLLISPAPGRNIGDLHVLLVDVTPRKLAADALAEKAAFESGVLAASPDVIYVLDLDAGQPLWISDNVTDALGYTKEELAGLGPRIAGELVHEEDQDGVRRANHSARGLMDREVQEHRYRLRHKDGSYRWLARRVAAYKRDAAGRVNQLLVLVADVTPLVEAEQRVQDATLHDPLTGLANRSLLKDRLEAVAQRLRRHNGRYAVVLINLDRFSAVNTVGGHAAGDAVLQTCARRLQATVRPHDTVARVGADEFVVVLEDSAGHSPADVIEATSRTDTGTFALQAANRLQSSLRQPVDVGDSTYRLTASMGLVLVTADQQWESALEHANLAMRRAKARGGNRIEAFDDALSRESVRRRNTEADLRAALASHSAPAAASNLFPVYQPIYDLAAGELVGFEVLARLTGRDGRAISPDEFIAVAEETGLVRLLGRTVLRESCQAFAAWRCAGGSDRVGLCVNLSARQVASRNLVKHVSALLEQHRIRPQDVVFELTETVLLGAGREEMTTLHALREMGCGVDIDDFGVGYGSLRYLLTLPVTGVKVDRSFTAGLPDNRASQAIVNATTAMASDLGLHCTVEGVETREQLAALPHTVRAQGYLLGRPGALVAAEDQVEGVLRSVRTTPSG